MQNDDSQATTSRANGNEAPTDFGRPVHCLLGLPIDALTRPEAIARIRAASATRSPCWLSTANVQYLVAAQDDRRFGDTVLMSDMSIADGTPLVWISRLLGVPIKERIAGADLFDALLRGDGGPLKVFFFGGPDGVAEKACQRLNALGTSLRCVGFASPGFGSVEQLSRPEFIDLINRSGADFLVVALGARKGQVWIYRNRGTLTVPVVSHLGAVVNFVAGTLVRAPVWMRTIGLEWLWRIKQEPVLWPRYWNDAKALLPLVVARLWLRVVYRYSGLREHTSAPARIAISPSDIRCGGARATGAGHHCAHATLSGSWSEKDIPLLRHAFATLTSEHEDLVFDVSQVGYVNEAVIALLMLLYGHQAKIGRTLTLLRPSKALCRTVKLHCAEFLLSHAHPR